MAINWSTAQENEAKFWRSIYIEKREDVPTYMPIADNTALEFTRKSLERFGHTMNTPVDCVVADVGCGPYGLIRGLNVHFERTGKRPAKAYGIDPLLETYLPFGTLAQGAYIEYFAAKAEKIPLEDSSCDYVYSTNVIDHVDSPDIVLQECRRICTEGGEVAFAIHVINPPFHLLGPFLFLIDRNHPHHFSQAGILAIARRYFRNVILTRKVRILEDHPEFTLANAFRSPGVMRGLKRWASAFLLSTCYIKCDNEIRK